MGPGVTWARLAVYGAGSRRVMRGLAWCGGHYVVDEQRGLISAEAAWPTPFAPLSALGRGLSECEGGRRRRRRAPASEKKKQPTLVYVFLPLFRSVGGRSAHRRRRRRPPPRPRLL